MNLFSFSTPCLKYKLIAATKGQYGWPGFLAPFETRYLNKLVTVTRDSTSLKYAATGIPVGGSVEVAQQLFVLDRISGALLSPTSGTGSATAAFDFPYGQDTSNLEQITDTHFRLVTRETFPTLTGAVVNTVEVQLSNQYTLPMVDADANDLISAVSVASMPWNTLQTNAYSEVVVPTPLEGSFPPAADQDYHFFPGGPIPIPQLKAAALAAYAPGGVGPYDWFPNSYLKMIGYVAMAGNYCQKTFIIDYHQTVLDEQCQSGTGSCASTFKVTPPAITPGRNAYVLIVPNCQCGG